MPVRVMLVEDNDVFREALELMLGMRDDVEVVAAVGDGAAAVEAALAHTPDVALVDDATMGSDGADATAQLRAAQSDLRIVALTKDAELDEIVAAIQRAVAT